VVTWRGDPAVLVGWAVEGMADAAATPIYDDGARVAPGKLRVLSGGPHARGAAR